MRHSIRWFSVVAVAFCLAARPAAAQIEAGDKSLAVQALVVGATGEQSFTFGLGALGFNYFKTRNLALRFGVIVLSLNAEDVAATFTALAGGVEWNFSQAGAKTVPFIAVDVTQLLGEDVSATGIAPSAGVRTFISRSTSFDVVGSYSMTLSGDDTTGGTTSVRLGFSFYFGKDSRR